MKFNSISQPSTLHSASRSMRLLVALLASLAGTSLLAKAAADGDNIADGSKGSVVIYSSPLAKGASPNALLDGQSVPISFSKKKKNSGSPDLLVVDLGKSFKLNTVKLKFVGTHKIKIYVVKTKPDAGTPWSSYIGDLQPDAVLTSSSVPVDLNGTEGEYIVVVYDSHPEPISGFFVTGSPANDQQITSAPTNSDHDHSVGALGETPPPNTAYGQSPSVPPQSN